MDDQIEMESLLTKTKADAICEKIAKGLEENKITGSANMIGYAMKVSKYLGLRVLKKDASAALRSRK